MEVEIHHTIRDTDEKEWESLVGTEYIERSHAWYKTVEDSEMVTMHYVLVRENNTLAAAACCFPYTEKMYIKMPLLEVKTPLGTSYAFFYRQPQHISSLVQGLKEILENENLKGILILEIRKENLEHLKNEMKKFIYFPIREDTYFDISFARFDEYLHSLKKDSVRRSVTIAIPSRDPSPEKSGSSVMSTKNSWSGSFLVSLRHPVVTVLLETYALRR